MPDEPKGIDGAMVELDAELAQYVEPRDESENVLEYFSRRTFELDGDEAATEARYKVLRGALDEAHRARVAEIERRRKALQWKYGNEVQAIVANKTAGTKQRHVKTPWGMVGFRRVKGSVKVEIENESDAIAFLLETLPTAVIQVTKVDKMQARQFIERQHKTIPGVRLTETPEYDAFYCKTARAELPGDETKRIEADHE